MSLHFFFVPAARPGAAQDELNLFIAQQRVLTLAREFVADGANSGWAVCVEVAPGPPELPDALRASPRRGSVDYKQVLPPADGVLPPDRQNPGVLVGAGAARRRPNAPRVFAQAA